MCKCAWAVNYNRTSNSPTTLPKSGVFHFVWHSRTNIRFLSSFQPPQTISREWSPARNESSFGFWTVRKHRPPDYGPGCISTPPKHSGKKCSTLPGKVNVESSRGGRRGECIQIQYRKRTSLAESYRKSCITRNVWGKCSLPRVGTWSTTSDRFLRRCALLLNYHWFLFFYLT